jgi:hypothetical protein
MIAIAINMGGRCEYWNAMANQLAPKWSQKDLPDPIRVAFEQDGATEAQRPLGIPSSHRENVTLYFTSNLQGGLCTQSG